MRWKLPSSAAPASSRVLTATRLFVLPRPVWANPGYGDEPGRIGLLPVVHLSEGAASARGRDGSQISSAAPDTPTYQGSGTRSGGTMSEVGTSASRLPIGSAGKAAPK